MESELHKLRKAAKAAVGAAAANLIEDGMVVGLGTGSTAREFIDALVRRCNDGLKVVGVATSEASQRQAVDGGIEVVDINDAPEIDLCIDGADEIDPEKRMIKGGGGALLREKIVATASREMVVIVDESKCVERLGAFPLPVEVVQFGVTATLRHLENLGFNASLRKVNGELFITDNGNYIADISFPVPLANPETAEASISQIVGIVETGFFFGIAGRVLVARNDGTVEFR